MNDSEFEKRIQRQPLRSIPQKWRARILQQASAAGHTQFSFHDFLWSLRWHLAGMSAVWLVITLLNLDSSQGSRMVAAIPPAKIPPPQAILASLRENRRQLSQMIETPPADAEQHKTFVPQPHSERRDNTLLA